MRRRGVTVALALLTACVAIACGSPSSTGDATSDLAASCAAPALPTPSSPPARKVSFAADVLPVLVASCAFGSCHGSTKSNNGIFLGAKGPANDASAIRAGLVGRPSTQVPSLPYVMPSDPSQSYLFRKLTGDFCGAPTCAGDACGKRMPRGGDPLDPASLATVREWIAQGAPE